MGNGGHRELNEDDKGKGGTKIAPGAAPGLLLCRFCGPAA
jgi:hypothetical protein